MAIIAIFDQPGMTQAQYEEVADKVNGGRGLVKNPADWPVPGLISHTSAPTSMCEASSSRADPTGSSDRSYVVEALRITRPGRGYWLDFATLMSPRAD